MLFLNLSGAISAFEFPFVIYPNGSPLGMSDTFMTKTMQTAFSFGNYGLASAMGVVLMIYYSGAFRGSEQADFRQGVSGMNVEKKYVTVLKYLSVAIVLIIVLVPLYLVLAASLKGGEEFATSFKMALPENLFNFENYVTVFEKGRLATGFMNTAVIMIVAIIGNVFLLGTMAAYALGRFQFKGKALIVAAYTVAAVLPTITTQVATFTIIANLGLVNTRWSVILLYLGTDLIQLNIYLQFVRSIPYQLDEAAIVEGASLFRVFRSVDFPAVNPRHYHCCGLLKAITSYNDIYLPYLYHACPKARLWFPQR